MLFIGLRRWRDRKKIVRDGPNEVQARPAIAVGGRGQQIIDLLPATPRCHAVQFPAGGVEIRADLVGQYVGWIDGLQGPKENAVGIRGTDKIGQIVLR